MKVVIKLTSEDVQNGVDAYKRMVEDDGVSLCDVIDVDYPKLKAAIEDEYECMVEAAIKGELADDKEWSIVQVLSDLNDTVSLSNYGFLIQ